METFSYEVANLGNAESWFNTLLGIAPRPAPGKPDPTAPVEYDVPVGRGTAHLTLKAAGPSEPMPARLLYWPVTPQAHEKILHNPATGVEAELRPVPCTDISIGIISYSDPAATQQLTDTANILAKTRVGVIISAPITVLPTY